MLYLVTEMVLSLALATVLGLGLGWWIRSSRPNAKNGDRDKELQRANSDIAKLEAKLREVGSESLLEPRIAELETQNEALESALEQARRTAEADRFELEEKSVELGRLRQSLEQAMQKAGDFERLKGEAVELAQRAELAEGGVAGLEARIAELTQSASSLPRLQEEVAALAQRAEVAEGSVAGLEARVAELTQRAEAAEGRVSETVSELSGVNESLLRANAEAENGAERLLAAQSRISELQRELFTRDASLSAFRERTEKLRSEAHETTTLADQLRSKAQEAAALTDELARERAERRAAMQELEELQSVHADCDFAFSTLRDQIVALRRRVAEVESGVVPKPRLAVARKNGTTGAATEMVDTGAVRSSSPSRPSSLLEAPSRLPDDLKQINGVGLRVEKQLNELGVYYFQQVANLSADEAAWLDSRLGEFRGKLYRDSWIDQARDLVAGREHVKEY